MVGYDVTSRVAVLLAKPNNWNGSPATESTIGPRHRTFEAVSRSLVPELRSPSSQQSVYELNFDFLKHEILELRAKGDAESIALQSQTAYIEELRKRRGSAQDALHAAQLQLRSIKINNGVSKSTKTVSTYAENHHQNLLHIFQSKSHSTTELRFRVENLRFQKTGVIRKLDSTLSDIRQIQHQLPCKKQIIHKHRMDLVNIKDEQIQKLLSEINKARNSVIDRETGGRTEHARLISESDSTQKNSSNLKNTMKSLKKEKADEENRWNNLLTEERRKFLQFQAQRCQKNQETSQIMTELQICLETMLRKKSLAEESVSNLVQRQRSQCDRKKALAVTGRELIEGNHQIMCDQQVVEPAVKKIVVKLKLRKTKINVKFSQAETKFNQIVALKEDELQDLHQQLEIQTESVAKLDEVSAATDDRTSKVRQEEENIGREIVATNDRIVGIKRHVASLRQKVHELNKWKRKLEAVGVTPTCYLHRLQERTDFVNSELLSIYKYQILCQDPSGLRPMRHGQHSGAGKTRSGLPCYLKDCVPPTSDPAFWGTLNEAFIASDTAAPYSIKRPPDECGAICRKYLTRSSTLRSEESSYHH